VRAALRQPEIMHRRRWLTLLVLCISLVVIGLDNTILNIAVPTLARDLHASTSQLQWIVDAYTLVFAGLLLTCGALGDRFGRYKGLALGLTIFGVGSAASAFSGSAGFLIATRAFTGVGAAFVMPATLSLISNIFTDAAERTKAIGIWAGVSALGVGLGPVTGGFLLTHFWWGSVFLVNVPIVALGLVGGWCLVPDSRDPSAPKLDPIGALLSIAGLAVVLFAIIEAPSHGWASTSTLAAFAIGVAILAGFGYWELHHPSPMLQVRLFSDPRFTIANAAMVLNFFTLLGSLFLLSQYLQSVLGYDAFKSGATLIPYAAMIMIAAPSSSRMVRRFGNRYVVALGLSLIAVAMVLVAFLPVGASQLHVIGITMLMGLGVGNVMAPATDSIMWSLPPEKAGVGSAMNDTTRQMGGALGVAVLGSMLSSNYTRLVTAAANTHHIPASLQGAIQSNIGQAVAIANSSRDGAQSAVILSIARHSFVSALHVAALLGAAIVIIAAVGVLTWLPARAGATSASAIPSDEVAVPSATFLADNLEVY
jgi:EmrB/QacA subfamily drug resistance transporter